MFILFLFLINALVTNMRPDDIEAMRKTLDHKRKTQASSSTPKRVKFVEPGPREALIELGSHEATEATLKVAVAAPPSSIESSVLITHRRLPPFHSS